MIAKFTNGRGVRGIIEYAIAEKSAPKVMWHLNSEIPHVHITHAGKTITHRIGAPKK